MRASSKCAGESAHARRLASAFVARTERKEMKKVGTHTHDIDRQLCLIDKIHVIRLRLFGSAVFSRDGLISVYFLIQLK